MDPIITGTLIKGGLDIASSLFNRSSARDTYRHRYQDTVQDMRKAGLNPALAYGQNPGGGAEVRDVGTDADIAGAIATAKQTAINKSRALAEVRQTNAQTDLLQRQADDIAAITAERRQQAGYATTSAKEHARGAPWRAELDRWRAMIGDENWQLAHRLNNIGIETMDATIREKKARAAFEEHRAELARLGIEPAKVAESFAKTFQGRNKPTIDMIREWFLGILRGMPSGDRTTNFYIPRAR